MIYLGLELPALYSFQRDSVPLIEVVSILKRLFSRLLFLPPVIC